MILAKPVMWMRLVLGAQRLHLARELGVVERLAGGLDAAEQRHVDDAGLEVVRDELPDLPRALDVGAHLLQRLRRSVVVLGDHRAAFEAFFGDRRPAHRRGPQRLHVGTVHAGQQEHLVVDPGERLEVGLVVDVARGRLDRDAHRVAQAAELVAVLEEVDHVRVRGRDHLLEAGIELQLAGLPAEQQRDQQAGDDDERSEVEEGALEQVARAAIEVFDARDHGMRVEAGVCVHGCRR